MKVSAAVIPLLAGLGVATASATGAAAQDWLSGTEDGWTGASACNSDGEICIALGCDKGYPLQFELWLSGGTFNRVPLVALAASITVDGGAATPMLLQHDTNFVIWTLPYAAAHAPLVDALRAGGAARVVIGNGTQEISTRIGLSGSRVALDYALGACIAGEEGVAPLTIPGGGGQPADNPAPEVATRPELAEPPVEVTSLSPPPARLDGLGITGDNPAALAVETAIFDCGSLDQTEIGGGFVRMGDVNGDQRNDALVNFGSVSCAGSVQSPYCGTGGCTTELWLGEEGGGYRQVFSGLVRSLTPVGAGLLSLQFHPSVCDGSGAESCFGTYRIEGDALVLVP